MLDILWNKTSVLFKHSTRHGTCENFDLSILENVDTIYATELMLDGCVTVRLIYKATSSGEESYTW